MAIYLCGVLAGISCGYLILRSTFAPTAEMTASSVRVFGFRGPLGAFIAAWGGIAMLTSAPFDNWWHKAYGLDVKIVSPPHTLLMLGIFGVEIGALLLILAHLNRDAVSSPSLQWLLMYIFGLMLVLTMFFRMEYTWDVMLHRAGAYISIALGVPLYYAAMWKASRHPWSCTLMCAFYTVAIIGFILILPLFPASPKLGPVFQPVTQFIPPKFPILLIVPAIALDLLWRRYGESNKLLSRWLADLCSCSLWSLRSGRLPASLRLTPPRIGSSVLGIWTTARPPGPSTRPVTFSGRSMASRSGPAWLKLCSSLRSASGSGCFWVTGCVRCSGNAARHPRACLRCPCYDPTRERSRWQPRRLRRRERGTLQALHCDPSAARHSWSCGGRCSRSDSRRSRHQHCSARACW
jgi:hypothetical protein